MCPINSNKDTLIFYLNIKKQLVLTNARKIIVNVPRVKQYLSPETAKSDNTEKEEIISDAQPMNDGEIISHANNSDFDPPALTLSHTRRPGRPYWGETGATGMPWLMAA